MRRVWRLLLLVGMVGLAHAPDAEAVGAPIVPHPRDKTLTKRLWGVEVMYVREAAAGYMLEFRYRVIDAAAAAPLFDRTAQPKLVHEATGAAFYVPAPSTVGQLRNSNPPIEGRTYWMMFANPGKDVQPGDLVTVEIGDFRAEGLVVVE